MLAGRRVQVQADNLWVVVPAFNEEPVIAAVIGDLRAVSSDVVVVDDCSSDDTRAVALSAGATVLRHPTNLGQGAALQTGIRYAISQGADYVVTFDADGQHRVQDIYVLHDIQMRTQADVVIGSRFLGSAENMPVIRRFAIKAAALVTRLTTGGTLTDAHNGLRLFSRNAAKRIRITQNGMAHASEITQQIRSLGLTVVEAPVKIVYTEYSLRKGQKLSNALSIVFDLIIARLTR